MDGRVALVTGGARGIGFAVCGLLAAEGMTVLVTARDPARATEAASALSAGGADVRPITLDVTDDESVAEAAEAVRRDPGRLDVLVNNAASFADWGATASSADLDAARGVMETSLWGSWRVAQAFLPLLREGERPRLVNVSSGGGSHGDPQFGLTTRGGAATGYGWPRRP